MTNDSPTQLTSDPILNRLKRIRGQLDGVIRMYEDERACIDVVHQTLAARNSLSGVMRELLKNETAKCTQKRDLKSLNEIIVNLLKY